MIDHNPLYGKAPHTVVVDDPPEQIKRRLEHVWDKERVRLQGAITRAYNASRLPMSLAAKVEAIKKVKALREELRQHKLKFFELTKGE